MWDSIDVGLILSEGSFDRAIVGSNDILGTEEGDWVGLDVVSGGEMNTIGAEDVEALFHTFVDLDDLPLYDFEEEEDHSVVNDGLFASAAKLVV
jgi:hypothetical protein